MFRGSDNERHKPEKCNEALLPDWEDLCKPPPEGEIDRSRAAAARAYPLGLTFMRIPG